MAAAQLLAGLMFVTVWHPQPGVWWDVTPGTPPRPVFGAPVMPSVYRGPLVPSPLQRAQPRSSPFGAIGNSPALPAFRAPAPGAGYYNPAAPYARGARLAELREEEAPESSEATGPVQRVVASGSAPVRDGDQPAARQIAIQQALRSALEQVVGTYVAGTTVAEKFQVLQDRVYTHSEGFVVPGKVLEESLDQGTLSVRLEVLVSIRPLVNRLRELGLTRAWRVGVSIQEGAGTLGGAAPLAHTAIVRRLARAGFQVVQVPAAADGAAVDVLISGTATATLAARMPVTGGGRVLAQIPLYQSRVEARAVRVETGEVLGAYTEDDLVSDRVDSLAAGTAVQLAANRIARRLTTDILALPASPTRRVRVEVEGFANRSQAQALEDALNLIPGVRRTRLLEFAGGVLSLEVEADVACAERLGTDLERAAAVRSFGLTVTTDTKSRLRARVRAAEK